MCHTGARSARRVRGISEERTFDRLPLLAAGAMPYVVVEERIPETVRSGTIDVAALGSIGGFALMMPSTTLFGKRLTPAS